VTRRGFALLGIVLAGCAEVADTAAPAPQPPAATAAAPSSDPSCGIDPARRIVIPANPRDSGDTEKRAYPLPDGSIVFAGRVTVDADGAPRAYNPTDTGLDFLANGGVPGNWWALATDAPRCEPQGRPVVQGPDDAAPGFFVTKTTMTNPAIADCRIQRRYVDSTAIPYVALPPGIARITGNRGRYAVVGRLTGGAVQPAIHADAAPRSGIGEASIELTRRLDLNPSPKSGGTKARDFLYLVFAPQEAAGFPASAAAVESGAMAAFERWGGEARWNACRNAVAAAPR
jgi:hypothetical protein